MEQDTKPVRASASFWRPTIGEQHKAARRAGIVRGVLFFIILLDKCKRIMPRGERTQTEGITKQYRKYTYSFAGRTSNLQHRLNKIVLKKRRKDARNLNL